MSEQDNYATLTRERKDSRRGTRGKTQVAALLVASSPAAGGDAPDRARIVPPFTVGRGATCSFQLADRLVSQQNFRIDYRGGSYFIEDLGSTNGTSVNGEMLGSKEQRPLNGQAVIRAGDSVLVFHDDAEHLLKPTWLTDRDSLGMAGPFHDDALVGQLKEAATSRRPPLLSGPSGSGKELAAVALARFWGLDPPRRYNVSAAASQEEMSRALFGVAAGAYTGVEKRDGLIMIASRSGQPLFLDEVHNLPSEAQATLLTVIEDGKFSRRGSEDREMAVDVRFVFASNEPDRLKPDLRARMWLVALLPLRERVADVPALFDALLGRALVDVGLGAEPPGIDGDVHHDLCLETIAGRFDETNVRGLVDLADRTAARAAAGMELADALDSVLGDLGIGSATGANREGGGGQYDVHRELIEAVYRGCGRNAKKTVELVKTSGVSWTISRRHLAKHLALWGFKEG
jgi:hypothetical protein